MTFKAALFALSLLPAPLWALDIALPEGSEVTFQTFEPSGSYGLPDAPYLDDYLSTRRVNGEVSRQVWTLQGDASTEQMIDPLRSQIEAAGYAIMLDCDADSCGGFDFRFSTDVVPAPDMFVDLADFRFLSGLKDNYTGAEAISVLVSRTPDAGLIQVVTVAPGQTEEALPISSNVALSLSDGTAAVAKGATVLALQSNGRAVLRDLTFQTGSSDLANLSFQSLNDLASFLASDPSRRVALVGHSDNVGSLEGNMALSEKRALSVKAYLSENLGVQPEQLEAYGVGFLSPISSNGHEGGKKANRRVEAVLLGN